MLSTQFQNLEEVTGKKKWKKMEAKTSRGLNVATGWGRRKRRKILTFEELKSRV